jgi:DNA processing protein
VQQSDREWAEGHNHHLIGQASADFPDLLQQIPDPPESLYVRGNLDALHLPALSIVGSRNPTRGGAQNAYQFAKTMGAAGFCIVSGLAQGIDAAAHRGALDAGATTVAFLGHGMDRIYPAANHELAARIAETGALVTEYPLGSPPRREHFPQRNRLISGLGLGTLVVEATTKSGSLISARLAAEQGREVFAIPGSIHNPMSRGCHQLIRQGAKLVECAQDIVTELGPVAGHLMQSPQNEAEQQAAAPDDAGYRQLLELVGFDPVTADSLSDMSGLTIEQVSSMLLILELEGRIEAHSGGLYSKLGEK